jgi:hypothetical protein
MHGMTIADAQRDVRASYANGAIGQWVSGTLWLVSAALSTWSSPREGIIVLAAGGFLIFPLTVLMLKLTRRGGVLPSAHPMNGLAMQVAFTVPLAAPVIAGAALYRLEWFYPAAAVIVGAHYLPFVFLYGMRHYAVLAAVMMVGGLGLAMKMSTSFAAAGWLGGVALCGFAAWVWPRRVRA